MIRRLVLLPPEEIAEIPDDGIDVCESVVADSEVAALRYALSNLPSLERRVLELRWGLGGEKELSTRQVAEYMRMSVGRVFYLHKNGIAHLRAVYGLSEDELAEAA